MIFKPGSPRHGPCTSIAAARTSASSKPKGVIQRQGHRFPLDQSRVAYLRYLRRERRQSPHAMASAEHAQAKAQMLHIQIMEKQRTLVRRDEHEALVDAMASVMLTHLPSWPARIAGPDLLLRRKAEALVRELRIEIARAFERRADEVREPPLAEQREWR
jgi:hypothetical protein